MQLHRLTALDWVVSGELPLEASFYRMLDQMVSSPNCDLKEWVVGDETLLLHTARELCQKRIEEILISPINTSGAEEQLEHLIEVDFNGPDLKPTAEYFGLIERDYIKRFCETSYVVKFLGFSPGFGYLTGGQVAAIPRKSVPRERMQAGAVAVAAGYACVYPVASPGV